MMINVKEHSDFYKTMIAATSLCVAFAVASLSVMFFAPRQDGFVEQTEIAVIEVPQNESLQNPEEKVYVEEVIARAENISWIAAKDSFSTIRIESDDEKSSSVDKGLELYRNPMSRAAVEWFYLRVTGNRDVTMAILETADREDIPLALAFALCYTESHFNRFARNVNVNGSIDRGLFQLNDRSFPHLENEDFFEPEVSAKYGLSHLRYCMNVAGNDATALAMYNAGITRVRNDQTPRSTLRYVGKIANYRSNLESRFAEEVLSHYIRNDQEILPVIVR